MLVIIRKSFSAKGISFYFFARDRVRRYSRSATPRATALALERAINTDNITVAVALRREHCTALKTLYGAEEKLIKINANRGKLITVDRALAIVNEGMQSALLVLRRLPDVGRDEAEKARLTAFLNGVLEEIRRGAATSLERSVNGAGLAKEII